MSEQIMWAVKGPDGRFEAADPHEMGAWNAVSCYNPIDIMRAEASGCRCVRVRVTEVQDGP
jgi:hypothetical protein